MSNSFNCTTVSFKSLLPFKSYTVKEVSTASTVLILFLQLSKNASTVSTMHYTSTVSTMHYSATVSALLQDLYCFYIASTASGTS